MNGGAILEPIKLPEIGGIDKGSINLTKEQFGPYLANIGFEGNDVFLDRPASL